MVTTQQAEQWLTERRAEAGAKVRKLAKALNEVQAEAKAMLAAVRREHMSFDQADELLGKEMLIEKLEKELEEAGDRWEGWAREMDMGDLASNLTSLEEVDDRMREEEEAEETARQESGRQWSALKALATM